MTLSTIADETRTKWDEIRRAQLGGTIAIVFGFASASLAFCASLLTEESTTFGGCRTVCFLVAVAFYTTSLIAGIIVTVTRLQDARLTAKIVARRNDSAEKEAVEALRLDARCLGRWTWRLFYFQLATFSIGAFFLLVTLWLVFYTKLFPCHQPI
jgi:hypothetical protein